MNNNIFLTLAFASDFLFGLCLFAYAGFMIYQGRLSLFQILLMGSCLAVAIVIGIMRFIEKFRRGKVIDMKDYLLKEMSENMKTDVDEHEDEDGESEDDL